VTRCLRWRGGDCVAGQSDGHQPNVGADGDNLHTDSDTPTAVTPTLPARDDLVVRDRGPHERHPLRIGLSVAADGGPIDPEDWAGHLPQTNGIAPRVRIGKRWINLLWLIPLSVALLLIVAIAVANGLRGMPEVEAFVRRHPGAVQLHAGPGLVPLSEGGAARPRLDGEGGLGAAARLVRHPRAAAFDRACALVAFRVRPALARQRRSLLRAAVCDRPLAAARADDVAGVSERGLGSAAVPVAELAPGQRLGRLQRPAVGRLLRDDLHRRAARADDWATAVARDLERDPLRRPPANHQLARTVHFWVLCWFLLFTFAHTAMVFTTGLLPNLNHIDLGNNSQGWGGFGIYIGWLRRSRRRVGAEEGPPDESLGSIRS